MIFYRRKLYYEIKSLNKRSQTCNVLFFAAGAMLNLTDIIFEEIQDINDIDRILRKQTFLPYQKFV